MRGLRFLLIVGACFGMALGVGFAQDGGGTIRGMVTEVPPDQRPIEGALVTIVGPEKEYTMKTDADGNYAFPGLPPGRYLVGISKEGYGERRGRQVTVVEGGDHFLPLKMSPQDGIVPFFRGKAQPENTNVAVIKQVQGVLERVFEIMRVRYGLDQTVYPAFIKAIEESLQDPLGAYVTIVNDENAGVLEGLLSDPDCRVIFTEYLTEAQLQDYVAFAADLRRRVEQAVVHKITAALDAELSLSAEQRQQVKQVVLGAAGNPGFPGAMDMLMLAPDQVASLVHHRLKVSIDEVLSEAQMHVWQGLIAPDIKTPDRIVVLGPEGAVVQNEDRFHVITGPEGAVVDVEKDLRMVLIPKEPKDAPKHVDIVGELDVGVNEKTQEQQRQLAEAKLAAHTERLGQLDEQAARRLEIAAKGTVQQFLEAPDAVREMMAEHIQAALEKRIVAEGRNVEGRLNVAAQGFERMMEELTKEPMTNVEEQVITDHPLYQRTIKVVLSEEAFARYRAYQSEREAFRQEGLRAVALVCMDAQLLLDDTQRQQLAAAAAALAPAPFSAELPEEIPYFRLFRSDTHFGILTPWQRSQFERTFDPVLFQEE